MTTQENRVTVEVVGVIGGGTMGSGIAQTFAQAGYSVRLVDAATLALERARVAIDKSLSKFVEKGSLADASRTARLSFDLDVDGLAAADYVIEAIPENLETKRDLLRRLDAVVRPPASFSHRTPPRCRLPRSAPPRRVRSRFWACTS